jgi:acetone carboxylase gamma subunit
MGNLEIMQVGEEAVYRCKKCEHVICSCNENYKKYAMKNDAPLSKSQPQILASKNDDFVLREYFCSKCGAMFEIDMVEKNEDDIWSVHLK